MERNLVSLSWSYRILYIFLAHRVRSLLRIGCILETLGVHIYFNGYINPQRFKYISCHPHLFLCLVFLRQVYGRSEIKQLSLFHLIISILTPKKISAWNTVILFAFPIPTIIARSICRTAHWNRLWLGSCNFSPFHRLSICITYVYNIHMCVYLNSAVGQKTKSRIKFWDVLADRKYHHMEIVYTSWNLAFWTHVSNVVDYLSLLLTIVHGNASMQQLAASCLSCVDTIQDHTDLTWRLNLHLCGLEKESISNITVDLFLQWMRCSLHYIWLLTVGLQGWLEPRWMSTNLSIMCFMLTPLLSRKL